MKPITTLFALIFGCQLTFAQLQSFRPTTNFSGFSFGNEIDINANEIIASTHSMISVNSIGKVYLFVKNNNGIEQQQTLFENELASNDFFGYSISIHNDFIAVGAPGDDTTASSAGAIYLYHKVNGTYVLLQKITAPDGMTNDYFGNNVKVYNNQLFVAANGEGLDDSFGNGAVYVYHFNGTNWVYSEKLTVPNTNALGRKIEVENETLVISSDEGGASIHTYRWDGTHWAFRDSLAAADNQYVRDFALEGNRLFLLLDSGTLPQNVSVYNDVSQNWASDVTFDLSNPSSSDQVYTEIAVNVDHMFLGSDQYILQMSRKFPVLHYKENGQTWQYQNTYYGNAPQGLDDGFGFCIVSKGNMTIFGAPTEEIPFSGNAYYLDMALSNAAFEKNLTQLYPNPVKNALRIVNENTLQAEVYSATGKLLLTVGNDPKEINLENLNSGLYFVKITTNQGSETFKIIKT